MRCWETRKVISLRRLTETAEPTPNRTSTPTQRYPARMFRAVKPVVPTEPVASVPVESAEPVRPPEAAPPAEAVETVERPGPVEPLEREPAAEPAEPAEAAGATNPMPAAIGEPAVPMAPSTRARSVMQGSFAINVAPMS